MRPALFENPVTAEAAWISSWPKLSLERFPAQLYVRASWGQATAWLAAGLGLSGISSLAAAHSSRPVPLWVAAAVGLGVLTIGLGYAIARRRVAFTDSGVEVRDLWLFGPTRWRLPYSGFRGVLLRRVVVTRKYHDTAYDIILLDHERYDRRLPLHVAIDDGSTGEPARRQAVQALADRLKLPAMIEEDGFMRIRPASTGGRTGRRD